MQITLKNGTIPAVIDFLYDMELSGSASRKRTRVINHLSKRLDQLGQEERGLLLEYAGEDEGGNPKKNKDGTHWDIPDDKQAAFAKDKKELMDERYIIQDVNLNDSLSSLKGSLQNYDEPLKGEEAAIYDLLLTELENAEEAAETETE